MKTGQKEGIILVNKHRGITSHDVVDEVRKRLGTRKVGHAGTLDPLAEGLLIIMVGKSTKLFSRFVNFDKEYLGVMKLGEVTLTGDSEGAIVKKQDYQNLNEPEIKEVFSKFEGEIEQIPPMVSALRVKGKRLYSLARRGIEIERSPRAIKIYELRIIKIDLPLVEFYVRCSKGTYIRKLAQDIGESLGCGAHMISIKRMRVGPFKLEEAANLDDINEDHLRKFTA